MRAAIGQIGVERTEEKLALHFIAIAFLALLPGHGWQEQRLGVADVDLRPAAAAHPSGPILPHVALGDGKVPPYPAYFFTAGAYRIGWYPPPSNASPTMRTLRSLSAVIAVSTLAAAAAACRVKSTDSPCSTPSR